MLYAILAVPLISISQDFRDVIDAYSKLIAAQEKYISSIKKATKAEEMASALRQLNSELYELNSVFKELEKKYPNFSVRDPKMPPEIKVLIASSEKLSSQLTETTIINLYRYGNEEVVLSEITKTKELLRTITASTKEKKQTSTN